MMYNKYIIKRKRVIDMMYKIMNYICEDDERDANDIINFIKNECDKDDIIEFYNMMAILSEKDSSLFEYIEANV